MSAVPQQPGSGPLAAYEAFLAAGELRPDAQQRAIAERLDALSRVLAAPPRTGGLLARLLPAGRRRVGHAAAPRGLYLWGGVGRGKSMLMDLFFAHTPIADKRRVHFHEFMQAVHARHHLLRAAGWQGNELIDAVVEALAGGLRLLCFDEFHVTDIGDAMILGRLFDAFFARGITIVATSNRHPDDLYRDGLNRQLFLPFIARIKAELDVLALDGATDYRLERLRGVETWLVPVDAATTERLRRDFFHLTDYEVDDPARVPSAEIEVGGRRLFVPKASKGVAVFSFKRLCANPYGAREYLAIAHRFHTLIVVAIPKMGPERSDWAARFMTLVDILYDNGVKLLCSAEVAPDALYTEGPQAFEFQRTASRLIEMQSEAYLRRGHGLA
ncbi:MAG: AFG1 family ATPase [Alphaproteobacteria bacterium]|nr:MAG: AFG1 family ATPase [Alphaproteobacteria bacterium]